MKNLSIKHFKKICDSLKKVEGIDPDVLDLLSKSYNKNHKTLSKTRSIVTIKYTDLGFDSIASYSFETDNYKLSRSDAKYLTIRIFWKYHNDMGANKKGKHMIIRKRYFLG